MAYKLFRSLVAPEKLEHKSYTDLVKAMRKHHNPTLSEIIQCDNFFCWFRQQNKFISTFILELTTLAEFCNFGTSLATMLHHRLVCAVEDSHIQCCLLSEPNLTLQTAMQIVLGMEPAAQNARTFQGGGEASPAISGKVLKFTGAKPSGSKQEMPPCTRCVKPGHCNSFRLAIKYTPGLTMYILTANSTHYGASL